MSRVQDIFAPPPASPPDMLGFARPTNTIKVYGPDGRVIHFPGEMHQSEIEQHMHGMFPAPTPTPAAPKPPPSTPQTDAFQYLMSRQQAESAKPHPQRMGPGPVVYAEELASSLAPSLFPPSNRTDINDPNTVTGQMADVGAGVIEQLRPVTREPETVDWARFGPVPAGMPRFETVQVQASPAMPEGPIKYPPRAPGFFSQLARTIEQKMPNVAMPDQILNIAKSGAKQEELQWTGFADWLKGLRGKVAKQDVMQFLGEHEVQVQEVLKGEAPKPARDPLIASRLRLALHDADYLGFDSFGQATAEIRRNPNWAEDFDVDEELLDLGNAYRTEGGLPGGKPKFATPDLLLSGPSENQRELLLTLPPPHTGHFRGGHYAEPGIVAHIRFNDRVGPEGEKILHIEEIQSDWHQKARELRTAEIERIAEAKGIPEAEATKLVPADFGYAERGTLSATKVPNAPFKSNWPELSMKRMMRYAAENNYDRITWTTGAQQAERYNLANHVESVQYDPARQRLTAQPKQITGEGELRWENVPPERIADHIGREAADRLLQTRRPDPTVFQDSDTMWRVRRPSGDVAFPRFREEESARYWAAQNEPPMHELVGEDLKVGGEGMKGFYDKMLPDFVNKYGKKWGVRVGQTEIPTGMEASRAAAGMPPKLEPVHSIDITPEMKRSVMGEGQPLFAAAPLALGGAAGMAAFGNRPAGQTATPTPTPGFARATKVPPPGPPPPMMLGHEPTSAARPTTASEQLKLLPSSSELIRTQLGTGPEMHAPTSGDIEANLPGSGLTIGPPTRLEQTSGAFQQSPLGRLMLGISGVGGRIQGSTQQLLQTELPGQPKNPLTDEPLTLSDAYDVFNAAHGAMSAAAPGSLRAFGQMQKHMRPEIAAALGDRIKGSIAEAFKGLPHPDEWEAAARAGIAKRGWYKNSGRAIRSVFGDDTPVFTGILAATSPRQSVAGNLNMAIRIFGEWDAAGRPLDPAGIRAVLEQVPGATFPSRVPNTIKAIQGKPLVDFTDPKSGMGYKVESFRRNLLGEMNYSTNDTWMGKFAGKKGNFFGNRANYLATDARTRQVAERMGWTPAEVQETVWSFIKTLVEQTPRKSTLKQGLEGLSDELIGQDADFSQLLRRPAVAERLRQYGLEPPSKQSARRTQASPQTVPGGAGAADPRVLSRIAGRLQRQGVKPVGKAVKAVKAAAKPTAPPPSRPPQ